MNSSLARASDEQLVTEALARAAACHGQGRTHEAEAIYARLLKVRPGNFHLLHLFGLLRLQQGRSAEALGFLASALRIDPTSADVLSNHGVALTALGQWEEARASYDQALALRPDHVDVLANRAHVHLRLGRCAQALADCDRALALAPDHAGALHNRGHALIGLRRPAEALAVFERLLRLRPYDIDGTASLGRALQEMGELEPALARYDAVLARAPGHVESLNNRGYALTQLRRYPEALASLDAALALRPDMREALNNRGNALRALNRHDAAIADFERALALRPDDAFALNNRGLTRIAVNRCQEALADIDRALRIQPDHPELHFNRGVALMTLGALREGFRAYEWRWQLDSWAEQRRNFAAPLWLGADDIADRTILLHAEQGLGDTLQFVRYAPLVAQRGARVILEAQPPLTALLASVAGVAQVVAAGEPLPDFDFHCPLMSLPLAFGTELGTVPAGVPYLTAPPDRLARWRDSLGERRALRIGIAWSGSPRHRNDHNRSIPFERFASLLDAPGVEFVTLQKGVAAAEAAALRGRHNVRCVGDDLGDFADTAALVSLLDVVICVDTAVAHLAGALGKPVFILLPYAPDFRWLLGRDDSPWYPSVRLFRQQRIGGWDDVLARVRHELQARAAASARPLSAEQMLQQAVALHQRGQLDDAQRLYAAIRAAQPQHFDALHLGGVLAQQQGRSRDALKLIDAALAVLPNSADALSNRGVVLKALDRDVEALASYERALAIKPDQVDALVNRATILLKLERFADALVASGAALARVPDNPRVLNNRGVALLRLDRTEEALASFERVLVLAPDDIDALHNLAHALQTLQRFEAALGRYEQVLARKADHIEALNNRGHVLMQLKRPAEALASYDRVLALKPDLPEALNNRGNVRMALNRPAEAIADYDRSLALRPNDPETLSNRGIALGAMNRFAEALATFDAALAGEPDRAEVHFNRALALLTTGALREGFAEYEWRWRQAGWADRRRDFTQPQWLGEEALDGKTILLHAEQGFGDTLQFVRFLPLVARRGARVILEVPPALKALVAADAGVDALARVRARGEALPGFDLHCPLMSLPLAFATELATVPADVPYLHADTKRAAVWREWLGPARSPRVAVAWAGSAAHRNDHNRSVPLTRFAGLLDVPDIELLSIQKDVSEADAAILRRHGVIELGQDLRDFADTAALLSVVDLVVAVDTAAAHLAGALGANVWVLLPFSPDFRWLTQREDSPWYPTARLFRQPTAGDWDSVLARVRGELARMCTAAVGP